MKSEADVLKTIGGRIQKIRKEKGYTQMQLAEIVGISTNYLSDLERGVSSPRLDKLVGIINALNCSADDVFADVLEKGYEAKSSRLSEQLEKLKPQDREKALAILAVFIENSEK